MEPFVPLVVRSHYSLLWGVLGVEQLVRAARRLGYDRLALTDTDNPYGLWSFLAACRREGVTPIVGVELTDPHDPSRGPLTPAPPTRPQRLARLTAPRRSSLVRLLGMMVLLRVPLHESCHDEEAGRWPRCSRRETTGGRTRLDGSAETSRSAGG
ncbi:MAG: PHP domain-containing protein [Myxococcota bacterium]|jgi:hypothetical protein|nr:PHP domain-containing protein [Myxococcota bacterium]